MTDLSNPNNPPTYLSSTRLTSLAHSDSCLYGGNSTTGFLKSSDAGNTWSAKNNGLPVDSIWNPWSSNYYYQYCILCIDVTTNYIFCGTKKGIYRNYGILSTWKAVNSGLPIDSATFIKSYNDTLFSAIGNILYKSTDFGNSWSLLFTAPSSITSFLKIGCQYYTGTIKNGIYYYSNHGLTWNAINTGLTDLNVSAISYYDSTLICGTNSKGVFYYLYNQWVNNKKGMICSNINYMTSIDSFIVASAWDDVFLSDLNNNWSLISPIFNHNYWASVRSFNDTIILSVDHETSSWPYYSHYILYSADKGITWNSLINQPPFVGDDPYNIYCFHNRIFAYENEMMYFTDNLGLTWTNIPLPSKYCNYFYGFAVFDSIPFASACGNAQLVKLNSSLNWILSNNGLPNDEPNAISFCNGALFTYVTFHGMYSSLDSGNTWSYASNGLITGIGIQDFANYNSNLFVTTENGVFVTSDFGQSWNSINNGLRNLNTSSIKILNDTLYVGTYGNGVWKRAITSINLGIKNYQLPYSFIKIFPNPFSLQTTLWTETSFKDATLSVVNCFGQFVKQTINVSGQKVTFFRDNLPEGIYFIRLSEGNKIYTGKLIIIDN